jgi:hypothetical protein
MIRGLDNVLIYTSTKETCLAACLNEVSVLPTWHRAHLSPLSSACCVSVSLLQPVTKTSDVYIVAPEPISPAPISLCACNCILPVGARQRLGKHVPAAKKNC